MSHRETTQADLDLDRVTQLFDQALTSKDERVVNALRSLLMIVALTDPETPNADIRTGPFRQLQKELEMLRRNVINLELQVSQLRNPPEQPRNPWNPGPADPYGPNWGTGTKPSPGLGWVSSQTVSKIKEEE